jgi:outer membrane lipoprotein SlyB
MYKSRHAIDAPGRFQQVWTERGDAAIGFRIGPVRCCEFHRAATFFDYDVASTHKGVPSTGMIEQSIMCRYFRSGPAIGAAAMLFGVLVTAGCAPNYSPDTYASAAAQQANKVDQGIIVGVRAVQISADTTLAMATGGAAGGVAGSTIGEGAGSALGTVGGTVAGGVVGNVIGHAEGDTDGFEYIVKKPNGDLLSVTQKDPAPLGIGAHVLIIEGPQARIVPDYTVPVVVEALHPEEAAKPAATAAVTPKPAVTPPATPASTTPVVQPPPAVVATPLPPPATPVQLAPTPVSAMPAVPLTPTPVSATPAEPPPAARPDDASTPKPASGS